MDENNVKVFFYFVEVKNSLGQLKGKLGHVAKIHVIRLS